MFRKTFFAVLLLSGVSTALAGNSWSAPREIDAEARITGVVVYTDRAMVRKEAVCALRQGNNLVRLTGLTTNLIDRSVQVGIKGQPTTRILDVKVEQTHLQKAHPEKIRGLQDRLDGLNKRIKALSDEVAAINGANDFLKRVTPFAQNQKIGPSDVERYARFLEKSLAENFSKTANIEDRLKRMQEEKKAVENELAGLMPAETVKSVAVLLQAEKSGEAVLSLSYITSGAGWSPQYEVRADSTGARVTVNAFVAIRQSTAEDWRDAQIEVSTAKPTVGGVPPELPVWYVDVYRQRLVRSKAAMPVLQEARLTAEEEAGAPSFVGAKVEEQATSVSFTLPHRTTVPSDGQPHRVLIASSVKETTFEYYAVPKLSPYTYLRAGLESPFSFPMLPGDVNVYLDSMFVSTWRLPKTVVPGEKMEISLGVDEGIKVGRKLLSKFTGYEGVISREARVNYEYSIDVMNGKGHEIRLNLMDQFPVSRNEQIKVVRERPQGGEAQVSEDGLISWVLKLAPQEKKELRLKFRVEHPKDLKVVGLE
jgi:uncharacterized protein (TIGR02231 family)